MEDYRFRKASDINREYPLFELINGKGEILFDIGMSDENEIEVAFHENISNKIFNILFVENWINIGKGLVLADFDDS